MVLNKTKLKDEVLIDYSEEEREKIIQYFIDLRTDFIKKFLRQYELPTSGTKEKIRKRIKENLETGIFDYNDLIDFINIAEPCGRQHIFLYEGPESKVIDWRKEEYFNEFIEENELNDFVNADLPIIPPETLSLTSIKYTPKRKLELYVMARLEYWERKEEFDEKKTYDGQLIDLKAHAHLVDRGIIIFSWDLVSNNALLQILQLPTGYAYEQIEKEFKKLIKSFFDLDTFEKLDLSPLIEKLHILEENGTPEARSHNFDYLSVEGRRFSARSPTSKESVIGETEFDNAMSAIRDEGIGHIGNFYWLSYIDNPIDGNILEEEVHTIILGNEGRINFQTPNKEEDIKYVLSRVRNLSE